MTPTTDTLAWLDKLERSWHEDQTLEPDAIPRLIELARAENKPVDGSRRANTAATQPINCPYCGNPHALERCPRIRSITYYPANAGIQRLEFFEPSRLRSHAPRYDAQPPDHLFDTEHTTADFWPPQARRSWPAQVIIGPETLRKIVHCFIGKPELVSDDVKWAANHLRDGEY